ncbi:Spherulin-4 [Dactylellina cionopaga]|nr:Spherulin-4 [Dactylellina cionopaga]
MNRPYMAPEKIPEIHLVGGDHIIDVETQGKQRSLLYRPMHGEIKYRHAEPYKKTTILLIALLLTSVIGVIGALKMKCGGDNMADGIPHGQAVSGLFKRIVVPERWNPKKLDDKLFERDFGMSRPQGWTSKGPVSGINKRDDSLDWKNPKGWKGRIGSIHKRGRGWRRPNSAGSVTDTDTDTATDTVTDTASSTTQQITDSLNTGINASITIPLYSYPGDGAKDWAPIFKALNSSSSTSFTIIINPDNGPGVGYPDVNFQTGIKKLQSFPNAQVFGYVHQSHGERSIDEVEADLLSYASWRASSVNIALDGIFFDESPADKAHAAFVATVNNFAKVQGLSTTIQNTGAIPDKEYFLPTQKTDITVIMEESFDEYSSTSAQFDNLDIKYGVSKSAFSFIIYEAPTDTQSLRTAVTKMTKQAGHIFLSDLAQNDAYTNISTDHFADFITAMVKAFSG